MFREQEHEQEKKDIARIASTFLGDNQAIFIDSSTTASFLAPHLSVLRNTIVVTNGLRIAVSLDGLRQVKTFLAGGRLRAGSGSILGDDALDFIGNFRADLAFLSCSGITEDGVFMASQEQATIKRKMMHLSDQVVLLCDHSKFNTKGYFKLSDPSRITALITDEAADKRLISSWEQQGVEVLN
nr:DeoR/GlpR transcriptional regulator [Lacticaseibacillus absianus]